MPAENFNNSPFDLILLKERLEDYLINNNLLTAFELCKELPLVTEKRKEVIILLSRFKQLEKDRHIGIRKIDDYDQTLAMIRNSFVDFYTDLIQDDFKPPPSKPLKKGIVLYRIPRQIPLLQPVICTISIAADEQDVALKTLNNSNTRLKKDISISNRMSAELIDINGEVFKIKLINNEEQWVDNEGYTKWIFQVTPLKEGTYQLLIKVSTLEFDFNTKDYLPRDITVFETVDVITFNQNDDLDYTETASKEAGVDLVFNVVQPRNFSTTVMTLWENKYVRTIAYSLVFLLMTTGLYALYKGLSNSWRWTKSKNTPSAYQNYIDKRREKLQDIYDDYRIQEAFFRKGDISNDLKDLRKYLNLYPEGKYRSTVLRKLRYLEKTVVNSIQKTPDAAKIMQYFQDFPYTTHLQQITKVIKTMPDSQQTRLVQSLKKAYIQTIELDPTLLKLDQYAQDFPNLSGFDKIKELLEGEKLPPEIRSKIDQLSKQYSRKTTNETANSLPENPQAYEKKPLTIDLASRAREHATSIIENAKKDSTLIIKRAKGDSLKIINDAKKRDSTSNYDDPFQQQMIPIKGGTYTMGSKNTSLTNDEAPHEVTVNNFLLSKYEVTQRQWRQIMGKDPDLLSFKSCDECPVETVSWNEIQSFIKKLNALTGKLYRLPTEEEWEYAAKGGEKKDTLLYSGSSIIDSVAWYAFNAQGKTHNVGGKGKNRLGLYDMTGNVREWCDNWYNINPLIQISQANRVTRGGSWYDSADFCRVSFRSYGEPANSNNYVGFRLARSR